MEQPQTLDPNARRRLSLSHKGTFQGSGNLAAVSGYIERGKLSGEGVQVRRSWHQCA